MVSSFLYDKAKDKYPSPRRKVDIGEAIKEYEVNLEELRKLSHELESKGELTISDRRAAAFHEETLLKLKEADPAIHEMVEKAVRELETKGKGALFEQVDSYWK